MKKLILLTIVALGANIVNAQWTTPAVSGTTIYSIKKVYFLDANNGFIGGTTALMGGNGVIAKTTNGGTSWTTVHTETGKAIFDIFFTSSTIGFAVGYSGLVLKTINGGTSWTKDSLTPEPLEAVYFPTASIGYVTGGFNSQEVFKTTDGGTTWNALTLPGSLWQRPNDVFFTSSTTGFIVGGDQFGGGQGKIYHTSDGGTNWDTISTGGVQSYFDVVYFFDSNNGYIGGYGGTLLKTTDGGLSWSLASVPGTGEIGDIKFINSTTGFACAFNGEILKTTDGGVNWFVNADLSTYITSLYSISFPTSTTGYTAGLFGSFLGKTTNGGGTGTGIFENEKNNNSLLTYPNPSNGKFIIEMKNVNGQKENDVIEIYNVLGEKVYTVHNIKQQTANEIDLSNSPKGIYFVRLLTDDREKIYTRKIVIH